MNLREFTNGLRKLHCIDAPELERLGFPRVKINAFLENPYGVFMRCDDESRDALWPLIQHANRHLAESPPAADLPDHRRAERDEARLRIREIVIEELAKQNEAAKSKECAKVSGALPESGPADTGDDRDFDQTEKEKP